MTAQSQPNLQVLQFRNGLYQGQTLHGQPQGIGLLLDDYMRFYVSQWSESQLNGRTLIFNGHGKYLYGMWQNGQPHGFNIFRSGDIVLLGHFLEGQLIGEFIVVFQRQNLLAVVVTHPADQSYTIKSKFQFMTEDDIKKVSETLSFTTSVPRDFFSMIKFIKMSFMEENVPLRFVFDEVEYRFGFNLGLSVCFNDDNFINRVGWMNDKGELTGLGAMYGLKHGAVSEQGNFQTKSTIKYKTYRPQGDIKTLLSAQHRRSIHFTNDYIDYGGVFHIQRLDELLRHNVINQLVDDPLNNSAHYSEKELNDSLEYYPKNKQQGLRLALIRETLYKSVGRIGSEMIPAAKDPSLKPVRIPDRQKHLHYTPDKQEEKSYTLTESHKQILEQLLPYKYETTEKRRHRLMIQRQIDLKEPDYTQSITSTSKKISTPIKSLKQDQPKTTASKQQIQSNLNSIHRQAPWTNYTDKPQTYQPFINQFSQQYQQPNQDLPLKQPSESKHPNFKAQYANSQIYQQTSQSNSSHNTVQPPFKKQRTPGKAVHRQPVPLMSAVNEVEHLPKFNGGDSPHNEMDLSHEQNLPQNPSSRRFIPVVHGSTHFQPSADKKGPAKYIPPIPKNVSYLELHKKQKERIFSRGGGQEGTIRTVSKSPIRTATTFNPSHSETYHYPTTISHHPLPRSNAGHLQQIYPDVDQSPAEMYFRQQQKRLMATENSTKKYNYIRDL